jgi:hypothetical protein
MRIYRGDGGETGNHCRKDLYLRPGSELDRARLLGWLAAVVSLLFESRHNFLYQIISISWLLMRYPMAKTTRAKLVRMYYELCILPGIAPRVIRGWADMLSRLLSNKPGFKKKLELTDLALPWQPLWRVLQKELWPKQRLHDSS